MAAADTVFSELQGRAGVNKHKILLVDDSSMNRAILSSMEDLAELQERRELLQLPEGVPIMKCWTLPHIWSISSGLKRPGRIPLRKRPTGIPFMQK